jgi:hypothetical protein
MLRATLGSLDVVQNRIAGAGWTLPGSRERVIVVPPGRRGPGANDPPTFPVREPR